MFRLLLIAALFTALLVPATAAAANSPISMKDARSVARAEAAKLKRGMADQGAQESKILACQRRKPGKVLCVVTVLGYDMDEDMDWQCWMPLTVRPPVASAASGKRAGYRVRYRMPVCA